MMKTKSKLFHLAMSLLLLLGMIVPVSTSTVNAVGVTVPSDSDIATSYGANTYISSALKPANPDTIYGAKIFQNAGVTPQLKTTYTPADTRKDSWQGGNLNINWTDHLHLLNNSTADALTSSGTTPAALPKIVTLGPAFVAIVNLPREVTANQVLLGLIGTMPI